MARAIYYMGPVTFLAIAIGCSRESPLPPPARPIELPPVVEFSAPKKPTASEPKAALILAESLKAHTGGKVERLERLKSCSFTRTGIQETGVPGGIATTWAIDLVWPDRYHMRTKLEQNGVIQSLSFGTQPKPWRFPSQIPTSNPQDTQPLDEMSVLCMRSQHMEDSFVLIFPLADPRTIVASAGTFQIGPDTADGLHVWSPALEYALVYIDQKTHLMKQFTYRGMELGNPDSVIKTLSFAKHEAFQDILLPVEMDLSLPSRKLGRWNKFTIEPGKTFDPTVFEKP